MASDFSSVTLQRQWRNSFKFWGVIIFRVEFHTQSNFLNCDVKIKIIAEMQGLQKFMFHSPFWGSYFKVYSSKSWKPRRRKTWDIRNIGINPTTKKNPHIVIHKSKIVPKSNRKHEAEGDRVKIDSIQR